VEGIEHASYVTLSGDSGLPQAHATDEQLAALAASGIGVCPTLGGFNAAALVVGAPQVTQLLADAGITPEQVVERRLSLLRRMAAFGTRFISGADAGIAPSKAHGGYAEAVIELSQVTGTVPALVATSSGAAAAIGLGASKGRLRRGYVADVLVVGGDIAADLTALRDVRQVVLRGLPASSVPGQS
jgi:imidazolonepropionase-like amidohydrolase